MFCGLGRKTLREDDWGGVEEAVLDLAASAAMRALRLSSFGGEACAGAVDRAERPLSSFCCFGLRSPRSSPSRASRRLLAPLLAFLGLAFAASECANNSLSTRGTWSKTHCTRVVWRAASFFARWKPNVPRINLVIRSFRLITESRIVMAAATSSSAAFILRIRSCAGILRRSASSWVKA